jgi:predicted RNA binding protein YcfA (HicA-like mRNA interferase family)
MADIERLKTEIQELAGRIKSVRFAEIERIVNQLERLGFSVARRRTSDGWFFKVSGARFSVVVHNRGQSQLKSCYVREFLIAMMELDLYE